VISSMTLIRSLTLQAGKADDSITSSTLSL
jgi:hypothetical protein